MGNYFRQIYTGSGAEGWTSTLAGRRGGVFSFLLGQLGLGRGGWVEGVEGVGGVRGGGVGMKVMEGSWWREGKVM